MRGGPYIYMRMEGAGGGAGGGGAGAGGCLGMGHGGEAQIKGTHTHGGRYVQYNVYGNLLEVSAKYVPPIRPVGRGACGIIWCVRRPPSSIAFSFVRSGFTTSTYRIFCACMQCCCERADSRGGRHQEDRQRV